MEITDFVLDSKFTFGDYDYRPGYHFNTSDTSFGAKPEAGDHSADYTITDVKNITSYVSRSFTDDYYEIFAVTEVLNGDDEEEEYYRFVIVPHELKERYYTIEERFNNAGAATWHDDRWDFSENRHTYESLDEAEEAFNQAVYEASDPRRDSDVKSITLLCTDTYDGTDECTEVAYKEFRRG